MIKILVTGASGRMGGEIARLLEKNTENTCLAGTPSRGQALNQFEFDCVIDFTRPHVTLDYCAQMQKMAKPLVTGTTGFSDQQYKQLSHYAANMPLLHGANMSIGINLCYRLLADCAAGLGKQADIDIIEAHHRNKVDAPSGTALEMGRIIANRLDWDFQQVAQYNRSQQQQRRADQEIGIASLRGGATIGDHKVIFALPGENIEISHKAVDRSIYARGALKAACWLVEQSNGLYGMNHVLGFD